MSSIDEKIARAKKAQEEHRPFRDVPVTLDTEVSDERNALLDEWESLNGERRRMLEPDDQRLAMAPDTSEVDKKLKAVDRKLQAVNARQLDTLIIVRVYKLPGDAWAELVARNPRREGVKFDEEHGYNIHAVTKHAVAAFGRLVEGDEVKPLEPEQWEAIWPLLGGNEFGDIADQVYFLNILEPALRSARLKNSYEAALASAKK